MSSDSNEKAKVYHIGKLLLEKFRERPKHISQIDGFTGEEETNSSLDVRTIRLAASFRRSGLGPGDVLALSGSNHLDLHVPLYAGLLEGLAVAGVDPTFKYDEIRGLFTLTRPKIVFCQVETLDVMRAVSQDINLECKIVTFDGDYTMVRFINDNTKGFNIEDYKPQEFDTEQQIAWLVSTSGSTGTPKIAAISHNNVTEVINIMKGLITPNNLVLCLSPPQWISSYFNAVISPLHDSTQLQSSGPNTVEDIVNIINKYKPTTTMLGPAIVSQILRYPGECDLTCFKTISIGGSKVYRDMMLELKTRTANENVGIELYGQTETLGPVLLPVPDKPLGSCGKPYFMFQVKLVDPDTGDEVKEPNKVGELFVKGPVFKGYYKNPEATAAAFTPDGWFITGDMFYKDESDFYYFVERRKMIIKFKNYHIYPPQLEQAIRDDADVEDAAVVGILHEEFSEIPAAVVVRKRGSNVTAQDIKSIIENKFSDSKKLRGGVAFVDALPLTSTGKIARHKLRDLLKTARRE